MVHLGYVISIIHRCIISFSKFKIEDVISFTLIKYMLSFGSSKFKIRLGNLRNLSNNWDKTVFAPYVEQCYRYPSKELAECIKRNTYNLQSKILNGLPDLAIPNLNPLMIESALINPSPDFSCKLTDLKMWNMNNMIIDNFKIELGTEKYWTINMKYVYFLMDFTFNMKGKLLVLQLDSHGTGTGNISGVNMVIDSKLETYHKNGKEYLQTKNMVVKMKAETGIFYFENLFKNNKELNDRANQFINENFKVFQEEFEPVIDNIMASTINHIFSSVYSKFPLEVLFPNRT